MGTETAGYTKQEASLFLVDQVWTSSAQETDHFQLSLLCQKEMKLVI